MKRLLLAAALTVACGCAKKSSTDPAPAASAGAALTGTRGGPAPGSAPKGAASGVAMDLLARFDDCTLGYRGILLDLGDPTTRASFGSRLAATELESVERDGATWGRVTSRAVTLGFVLDEEPDAGVETVISARIRGGTARSVSVYLNGKATGQWALVKGEARVVETRLGSAPPVAGANELKFRFNVVGS